MSDWLAHCLPYTPLALIDDVHGQTNAICIDFGAYKRRTSDRPYKLAALRLPEMQIVCDDGTDFDLD